MNVVDSSSWLELFTARAHDATLWIQDDDFSVIPGVRYPTK